MALHRVVPSAPAPRGNHIDGAGEARAGISLGDWGFSSSRWRLGPMLGRSAAMERLFLQMRYLANHLRIALLEGEPGTGKQLAARTLHELSPYRGAAFVSCGAAQFFTEAAGRLREAQGGTLYLSGVDQLSHEQQGRLLNLLGRLGQTGSRALADPRPASMPPVPSDQQPRALLVSSTRPLRSLVLYGKFRGDLHAQLSAVHMVLPALRDRREDIPLLLDHFLKRLPLSLDGKRLRGFAPDLVPALLAQRWTGNVAELQAVLSSAAAACGGEWLRARDLPPAAAPASITAPAVWAARPGQNPRPQSALPASGGVPGAGRPAAPPVSANGSGPREPGHPDRPSHLGHLDHSDHGGPLLDPNLDRAILRHIRRVLANENGNKLRAARLLGISRSTLYRLLESDTAQASRQGGYSAGIAVSSENADAGR